MPTQGILPWSTWLSSWVESNLELCLLLILMRHNLIGLVTEEIRAVALITNVLCVTLDFAPRLCPKCFEDYHKQWVHELFRPWYHQWPIHIIFIFFFVPHHIHWTITTHVIICSSNLMLYLLETSSMLINLINAALVCVALGVSGYPNYNSYKVLEEGGWLGQNAILVFNGDVSSAQFKHFHTNLFYTSHSDYRSLSDPTYNHNNFTWTQYMFHFVGTQLTVPFKSCVNRLEHIPRPHVEAACNSIT